MNYYSDTCSKHKIVLCKEEFMQREFFFFDIIFYILVNEVKEFRKDINALRR